MRTLALTALVTLSAACGSRARLPTTTLELGGQRITVEVADDPDERHLGLMYRKELGKNDGMLFVYPSEQPRSFWMANTTIPLSIAYLTAEGQVVNIEPMVPLDRNSVKSTGPALYALEMNRGWFAAHGIKAGAKVEKLPGPAEK